MSLPTQSKNGLVSETFLKKLENLDKSFTSPNLTKKLSDHSPKCIKEFSSPALKETVGRSLLLSIFDMYSGINSKSGESIALSHLFGFFILGWSSPILLFESSCHPTFLYSFSLIFQVIGWPAWHKMLCIVARPLGVLFPGDIEISIFDSSGSLVDQIKKGAFGSGAYLFNYQPNNLAPGIYIVRVSSNNFSVNKKLIIQ